MYAQKENAHSDNLINKTLTMIYNLCVLSIYGQQLIKWQVRKCRETYILIVPRLPVISDSVAGAGCLRIFIVNKRALEQVFYSYILFIEGEGRWAGRSRVVQPLSSLPFCSCQWLAQMLRNDGQCYTYVLLNNAPSSVNNPCNEFGQRYIH